MSDCSDPAIMAGDNATRECINCMEGQMRKLEGKLGEILSRISALESGAKATDVELVLLKKARREAKAKADSEEELSSSEQVGRRVCTCRMPCSLPLPYHCLMPFSLPLLIV